MKTTQLIIQAILMIQCYIAGIFWEDQRPGMSTATEKVYRVLITISIAALGVLWGIAYIIIGIGGFLYHRFWVYFHLPFLFKYIIFKRHFPYKHERGKMMHELALKLNPKWYQVSNRIYVFIDNWVYINFGDGRNWTEDFSHENGNYTNHCCKCHNTFTGHKRRVICKVCSSVSDKPTFWESLCELLKF